jgi:hypothetical protein
MTDEHLNRTDIRDDETKATVVIDMIGFELPEEQDDLPLPFATQGNNLRSYKQRQPRECALNTGSSDLVVTHWRNT